MGARAAEELIRAAKEAMRNAHAPYSRFHVGAALETADGRVFTGCNVENASYGGTICAERVAAGTAVAAGARAFTRIAITSDSAEPVAPCGLCRQFLAEFGVELAVVSAGASGRQQSWVLRDLLPAAFTGADIQGSGPGRSA